MDKTNVGRKLRLLRDQTEYSVEEIAYKCDISTQEYKEIEIGKRYPSDTSLAILLELYGITEEDFNRRDFVDHEKRKAMIWYAQIVLSLILILTFFLPFQSRFTTDGILNGFDMMTKHNEVVLYFIFIAYIFQFFGHIGMYFNRGKFSNNFKIIFILINLTSLILLSLVFIGDGWVLLSMALINTFLVLHIGVTIYDLAKYPAGHDFLQDKRRTRFLIVAIMIAIYTLIYVLVLFLYFGDGPSDIVAGDIVVLVAIGIYVVSFFVIRKSYFSNRLFSSIYLSIPPIVLSLFYIIVMWGSQQMDDDIFIMSLLMLIPVMVINIDIVIEFLKRSIQKFIGEE